MCGGVVCVQFGTQACACLPSAARQNKPGPASAPHARTQAEAQAAVAAAEAERSIRAEAEGSAGAMRVEQERRARVFNDAVRAAVGRVQAGLEQERDELQVGGAVGGCVGLRGCARQWVKHRRPLSHTHFCTHTPPPMQAQLREAQAQLGEAQARALGMQRATEEALAEAALRTADAQAAGGARVLCVPACLLRLHRGQAGLFCCKHAPTRPPSRPRGRGRCSPPITHLYATHPCRPASNALFLTSN